MGKHKLHLTEKERKEARRLAYKKYWENNKDKESFKESRKIVCDRYRENNKEKIKETKRRYFENHPEAINYHKNYRKTERGKEVHLKTVRKNREELADWYIRQLISHDTLKEHGIRISMEDITPELVELKREALTFKRIIKSLNYEN